jgi:hypothetical protein
VGADAAAECVFGRAPVLECVLCVRMCSHMGRKMCALVLEPREREERERESARARARERAREPERGRERKGRGGGGRERAKRDIQIERASERERDRQQDQKPSHTSAFKLCRISAAGPTICVHNVFVTWFLC